MAALPYFDEIDPSTIDVLLITQYVFSSPSLANSPCLAIVYMCIDFHSTRQYFVSPISFINASFFSHWMLLWFDLACFLVCSFLVKRILWRDISYDDVERLHEILAARDKLVQGRICSCFRIREYSAQKSDIQVLRKLILGFGQILLCDNTSWEGV